jgi:hypothetical protein
MEAMPLPWQQHMTYLLSEFHQAFSHVTWPIYRVQPSRHEQLTDLDEEQLAEAGYLVEIDPDGEIVYRDRAGRLVSKPAETTVLVSCLDPIPPPRSAQTAGGPRPGPAGQSRPAEQTGWSPAFEPGPGPNFGAGAPTPGPTTSGPGDATGHPGGGQMGSGQMPDGRVPGGPVPGAVGPISGPNGTGTPNGPVSWGDAAGRAADPVQQPPWLDQPRPQWTGHPQAHDQHEVIDMDAPDTPPNGFAMPNQPPPPGTSFGPEGDQQSDRYRRW